MSRAYAVGMWQFMRQTGRGYGLRVDTWVDERRDPVKATDAAARHLRDLRKRFGSLYLAAAAYNAGAGKVSRGAWQAGVGGRRIRVGRGRRTTRATPRSSASPNPNLLANETRDYVPKLIAAAIIAKQPARYGIATVRGRAVRLRLAGRHRRHRPRRGRPAGGGEPGRDPRFQPAVPPSRHAAQDPFRDPAARRAPVRA